MHSRAVVALPPSLSFFFPPFSIPQASSELCEGISMRGLRKKTPGILRQLASLTVKSAAGSNPLPSVNLRIDREGRAREGEGKRVQPVGRCSE